MSKMKHLLRKLHIGGGINDPQRLGETRPVVSPSDSPNPLSSSSSSSNDRIAAVESASVDRFPAVEGNTGVDFNLLEEEFQVQLALAISVSDPDSRKDPESAQIDAAKRISLGCPVVTVPVNDSVIDSLSLRYWSYNVVNYNDKVMDGFYDVYSISSNSIIQGKMPLLVDLQAVSTLDNVDYEVLLVNRFVDPELRELEKKAYMLSLESQVSDGLLLNVLIQKLADLVVDRMGGPVANTDEISSRWSKRSYELRNALNSVILPIGHLDVGLSRHRALLFKVLADRINLPCTLVKGSYYTGTDDGAVNFIKINDGSEYIIDLMGAPGTLIPAEVPSNHLQNTGFGLRSITDLTETEKGPLSVGGESVRSRTDEALFVDIKENDTDISLVEKNQIETFEHEFGKLFPSSQRSHGNLSGPAQPSSSENIRVKNVSKYVISAAKNPEFAQKLHAVLLESGASPPPDLFSDVNQQDLGEHKVIEQGHLENGINLNNELHCYPDKFLPRHGQSLISMISQNPLNNFGSDTEDKWHIERPVKPHRELELNLLMSEVPLPSGPTSEGFLHDDRTNERLQIGATGVVPDNAPGLLGKTMYGHKIQNSCLSQPEDGIVFDSNQSGVKLIETFNTGLHISCNSYNEKIHPVLGEVSEWEIPWEDLQIGERIGIGSYGEVYHADWNGTEVAVKKFLDQDLSGDALVQFKCEAEIMLRLRHPNVVLFMGAVTRPPHLSILTEFLPRGSLYRLMHRPNSQLDEKRRMRMAIDVAKGMNYLHTSHPTIVHRDLKSPNLLVDKNWVVKVCDFGLSRLKHHTFLSSKSTAGTPEWMAPEVLRNEPANEKCDVYSFGVILWELVTCQIPWKGLNPMQVVGAVGFQNKRLEIPEDVDPSVSQIIHDCWQREPQLRPSFSQLISRLRHIQHLNVERT
ncbi:probable serine/threonine-protein kinase SIS8 [Euphorbia lathyris]|uniref:probable serine/threonine-protein kinase SIS8 n=1 Tax=Euphorbia lathyris TaxID=212925 RepID=UPI0033131E0A